jgi:hypothetical protein
MTPTALALLCATLLGGLIIRDRIARRHGPRYRSYDNGATWTSSR